MALAAFLVLAAFPVLAPQRAAHAGLAQPANTVLSAGATSV